MKRELDENKNYIPVYAEYGTEISSHFAYPMREIRAMELENGLVAVDRDDVDEPMIYTPDMDGYQYWLSQAKSQTDSQEESSHLSESKLEA
jgi:hypothetical protein